MKLNKTKTNKKQLVIEIKGLIIIKIEVQVLQSCVSCNASRSLRKDLWRPVQRQEV